MKKVARFVLERNSRQSSKTSDVVPVSFLMGIIAGSVGSLAGIGGSIICVPFLTMYLGLSSQLAHGTSMAVALGTSIGGTVSYVMADETASGNGNKSSDVAGSVHIPTAFALASMGTLMAAVGARVSKRLPERQLKLLFASSLLVIAPSIPMRDYIKGTPPLLTPSEKEAVSPPRKSLLASLLDVKSLMIGAVSGFQAGLFGVGGGTIGKCYNSFI